MSQIDASQLLRLEHRAVPVKWQVPNGVVGFPKQSTLHSTRAFLFMKSMKIESTKYKKVCGLSHLVHDIVMWLFPICRGTVCSQVWRWLKWGYVNLQVWGHGSKLQIIYTLSVPNEEFKYLWILLGKIWGDSQLFVYPLQWCRHSTGPCFSRHFMKIKLQLVKWLFMVVQPYLMILP